MFGGRLVPKSSKRPRLLGPLISPSLALPLVGPFARRLPTLSLRLVFNYRTRTYGILANNSFDLIQSHFQGVDNSYVGINLRGVRVKTPVNALLHRNAWRVVVRSPA